MSQPQLQVYAKKDDKVAIKKKVKGKKKESGKERSTFRHMRMREKPDHFWVHYTFLVNGAPTPPLSQHFALSEK